VAVYFALKKPRLYNYAKVVLFVVLFSLFIHFLGLVSSRTVVACSLFESIDRNLEYCDRRDCKVYRCEVNVREKLVNRVGTGKNCCEDTQHIYKQPASKDVSDSFNQSAAGIPQVCSTTEKTHPKCRGKSLGNGQNGCICQFKADGSNDCECRQLIQNEKKKVIQKPISISSGVIDVEERRRLPSETHPIDPIEEIRESKDHTKRCSGGYSPYNGDCVPNVVVNEKLEQKIFCKNALQQGVEVWADPISAKVYKCSNEKGLVLVGCIVGFELRNGLCVSAKKSSEIIDGCFLGSGNTCGTNGFQKIDTGNKIQDKTNNIVSRGLKVGIRCLDGSYRLRSSRLQQCKENFWRNVTCSASEGLNTDNVLKNISYIDSGSRDTNSLKTGDFECENGFRQLKSSDVNFRRKSIVVKDDVKHPSLHHNVFRLAKAKELPPAPEIIDLDELRKGVYTLMIPGYENAIVRVDEEGLNIEFFEDKNSNGIQDEGEESIDTSEYKVELSKVLSIDTIQLRKGWNFLSLPLYSEEIKKASDLSRMITASSGKVTQISKYDNGNWIHYIDANLVSGEEIKFGNDFNLIPGQAYFIYSQLDSEFALVGNEYYENPPISLQKGWSMVGFPASTKLTSNTFLQKCRALLPECKSIARYVDGNYDTVYLEDDVYFGNEFVIDRTSGYFVLNKGERKVLKF